MRGLRVCSRAVPVGMAVVRRLQVGHRVQDRIGNVGRRRGEHGGLRVVDPCSRSVADRGVRFVVGRDVVAVGIRVVGRARRREGVLAAPFVEHASVAHVHRGVVQRSEVAVHDHGGDFAFRVDVVVRRDFVVADPDVPAPDDVAFDVLHGDHGVALRTPRREGHVAAPVDRRAVDDFARHGLVAVVARFPEQFGEGAVLDGESVVGDVVADSVAAAVALDRCVEFVDAAGPGDVAVGRAFGAQVDAPFGALYECDLLRNGLPVLLGADREFARQGFGSGVDQGLDQQGVAVLPGDGEPVAFGGVVPAVGVRRHGDHGVASVGVEDHFLARHLHVGLAFALLRPYPGGFGAGCQQCGRQHCDAAYYHIFHVRDRFVFVYSFHVVGILS